MITELSSKILELRKLGYSYNKITQELKCSKGTVAYHCGTGQKAKYTVRGFINKDIKLRRNKEHRIKIINFSWRYRRFCGCKICGEKDPVVLEYDHRVGTTKLYNVSDMMINKFSMKLIKEEIRKCDILCANCHRRKTAKDRNYHTNII